MTYNPKNNAVYGAVATAFLLIAATAVGVLFATDFDAALSHLFVAVLVGVWCAFALGVRSSGWTAAWKSSARFVRVTVLVGSLWIMYSIQAGLVSPETRQLWTTGTSYGELKRAAEHSKRIARYREELVAEGLGPDSFRLSEVLLLPPADSGGDTVEIRSPGRWIRTQQRGFALNVVEFAPGVIGPDSFVVRTDSGPVVLPAASSSTAGEVRVSGLPSNSFGQARFVRDVDTASFVSEQQARWKIPVGERVVAFSYVPARYAAWRTLLSPVIGANSVPQWVLGIIGVIGVVAALITASKIPVIAKLILPKTKDADSGSARASPPSDDVRARGRPAPDVANSRKRSKPDQRRRKD
jgi:hypothetical protein